MIRAHMLLAATALLGLAACGHHHKHDSETVVTKTVNADGTTTVTTKTTTGKGAAAAEAAAEASSVEVNLPGGFQAMVKSPNLLGGMGDMDIDGVGIYPGAKIGAVKVNATKTDGEHDARVEIGFAAPDAPGKVADWYATQFAAKGRAVTRTGDTLTGKTKDGGDFTLAMTAGDGGGAKGMMTILSK